MRKKTDRNLITTEHVEDDFPGNKALNRTTEKYSDCIDNSCNVDNSIIVTIVLKNVALGVVPEGEESSNPKDKKSSENCSCGVIGDHDLLTLCLVLHTVVEYQRVMMAGIR